MIRMTLYLMELVTLLFLISTCYSHDLSLVSEMKGTSNRKIQDQFFFSVLKNMFGVIYMFIYCVVNIYLFVSNVEQ